MEAQYLYPTFLYLTLMFLVGRVWCSEAYRLYSPPGVGGLGYVRP